MHTTYLPIIQIFLQENNNIQSAECLLMITISCYPWLQFLQLSFSPYGHINNTFHPDLFSPLQSLFPAVFIFPLIIIFILPINVNLYNPQTRKIEPLSYLCMHTRSSTVQPSGIILVSFTNFIINNYNQFYIHFLAIMRLMVKQCIWNRPF